jgi:hypothetical protein
MRSLPGVLFVAIVFGLCLGWRVSSAEKAPRFMVGQVYAFAIDCGTRLGVGQDPNSGQRVPIEINDCYTESLKVKRVLDDGWIEVTDLRDEREKPTVWTVNPARAWGFAPVPNPHERVADLGFPHGTRGR